VTETIFFQLSQPGTFADPLTEVGNGARALLTQAVEAEVAAFLSCHADKLADAGRQRLARHGHLRNRSPRARPRRRRLRAHSTAVIGAKVGA
jgi:hypothetical protein